MVVCHFLSELTIPCPSLFEIMMGFGLSCYTGWVAKINDE